MSKWSKLKFAVLTAAIGLSTLQFAWGCLDLGALGLDWQTVTRYTAIAALFD